MSLYRNPNMYYGSAMKRRPRKAGKGFFSNIGSALSKAHDWVKSNKFFQLLAPYLVKQVYHMLELLGLLLEFLDMDEDEELDVLEFPERSQIREN